MATALKKMAGPDGWFRLVLRISLDCYFSFRIGPDNKWLLIHRMQKSKKFLGKRLSPLSAPYVRISHFLTGIFDRKSLLAVLKFERINRMSPLIEYSIFFKRVYQETS